MASLKGEIEKVPRGIQGKKSRKVEKRYGKFGKTGLNNIGAYASPKKGDRTRCPEGYAIPVG